MISSDTKEVIDKFIPVFESEPSIERVLLFDPEQEEITNIIPILILP